MGLFSCNTEKLRLLKDSLRGTPQPQTAPAPEIKVQARAKAPVPGGEAAAILQGYSDGKSTKDLAVEYSRSRTTISNILKRNNVKVRTLASPSASDVARMAQLYKSGLSLKKVGKRVGYDATTVRANILKVGVKMRDSHGRG
ncbi:MAG: helix-turn-helix domain-containing protein [Leucobacter sp.]